MIVRKNLNLRLILQTHWPVVVLTALWACGPTVLYYGEVNLKVSLDLPVSLLGTTLAFLIAFRNNNAYDRWWEARRIWGEVVNDSRSFGAQVLALLDVRFGTATDMTVLKRIQQELIYRQIGFAYALKDHLRRLPVDEATSRFFSAPDWEAISHQRNIPNAILYQQALQLSRYTAGGYLEDFRHMQFDTKLGRFFESLGKCERIKNTVFPPQYDYFTRLTFLVFIGFLPFTLIEKTTYLTVPVTGLISFIFSVLQTIGQRLETPFENAVNDIPMTALCKIIEIDLRQQLGESTDLPTPETTNNGYLY